MFNPVEKVREASQPILISIGDNVIPCSPGTTLPDIRKELVDYVEFQLRKDPELADKTGFLIRYDPHGQRAGIEGFVDGKLSGVRPQNVWRVLYSMADLILLPPLVVPATYLAAIWVYYGFHDQQQEEVASGLTTKPNGEQDITTRAALQ